MTASSSDFLVQGNPGACMFDMGAGVLLSLQPPTAPFSTTEKRRGGMQVSKCETLGHV